MKQALTLVLMTASILLYGCSKSKAGLGKCVPTLGSSCWEKIDGGDFSFSLEGTKPGEEYVLTIQSLEEFKSAEKLTPKGFTIAADPSDGRDESESFLTSEVKNYIRTQPQDSDIDLVPENVALPESSIVAESIDDHLHESPHETEKKFYVPNFSDYESLVDGERKYFFLRDSLRPNTTGVRGSFLMAASTQNLFNLRFEPEYVSTPDLLLQAADCLNEVFPNLKRVLGKPVDFDGNEAVDILVTELPGGTGKAVGRFNQLDRFKTSDGKAIVDSNQAKEVLYISSRLLSESNRDRPGRICSTSAHEYQHLINFDYKVMRQIPEKERGDLGSITRYKLQKERLGIDEGISHLVEELTGADQRVYLRLRDFLENQSRGTFALEVSYGNPSMNSQSRGANLALVSYALNRFGGSLNWNDPKTQAFLSAIIQSSKGGMSNISRQLEIEPEELLADFWSSLDARMYSVGSTEDFLPPMEFGNGITRGIMFLDRDETVAMWKELGPASFHPLAADVPFLSRAQNAQLYPETYARWRWIAPSVKPIRQRQNIEIRGKDQPYLVVWSRVR